MEREVTIRLHLTDDELARIVPSGNVYVTIDAERGTIEADGEILQVKDAVQDRQV